MTFDTGPTDMSENNRFNLIVLQSEYKDRGHEFPMCEENLPHTHRLSGIRRMHIGCRCIVSWERYNL